ncbi:MAG: hypothetical protein ACR2HD_11250 [Solirubrobacteraceae bacterium]|nr:MAG: hypothetical protein DLM63_12110 [Solirubrobacterales bacterium]
MSVDVDIAAPERSRHVSRWDRLAPLSGAAFFVLLLVSSISGGETPGDYASGATVLSDFSAHPTAQKLSNLLAALGVVFLVLFAGRLRAWLQAGGADALASAVFGGAVVLAVGGAARAGIGWALASGHDSLEPSTAQALNVLFASHYPAIVGIAIFMFAAWGSILRTGALPPWLGWVALPIALAAVAPPSLFPLIATGLWIAAASVVMYRRDGQAPRTA